jgi:serine O-acetyltransferase
LRSRSSGVERQGIRSIPEDLRFGFSEEDEAVSLSRVLPKLIFSLRGQAVVLFRVSQSAHRLSPLLGAVVRYLNQVLTGADISPAASVAPGLRLPHPGGVVIGPGARLGRRCTIMQGVTLGGGRGGEFPKLGERVYVGPGAKLLGGIEVGPYASIGANAVAIRDVPARAFAAGVPAVVQRESSHAAEAPAAVPGPTPQA